MKVLLIDSTEISQAPYLESYTQIFDKQKEAIFMEKFIGK